MNGINKKTHNIFSHNNVFLVNLLYLSLQVHLSYLWLHSLSVWLHWKYFTLTVYQRVSSQVYRTSPPIFIRFILAFAGFLQNDITVFVVDLFVILSGVHHITGCVTLWICTALCSGNMGGWTSPTLLCPRGKSSNWSRRALSGKVGFLFDIFFSDLIIYFVMQINRSGKEICCF